MDDYLKLVSGLPLPTVEQTQAFADHVSRAHSWYKHLPVIPPGHAFLFFLDPQAGRSVQEYGEAGSPVRLASVPKGVHRSHTTIKDIKDQSQCGHYSMKPTCDYLAQFGHWNYSHGSYKTFQAVSLRVWSVETVDLGPDASIKSFDVPLPVSLSDKVRQQCFCQLTALISGYAKYRCSLNHLPSFLSDFQRYLEAKPGAPCVAILQKLRWDLEENGIYGWRPDTICDIDIAGKRSRFWANENSSNNRQLQPGRSLHLELDLGSLAADEHSAQRAALNNGLRRSRALFAKVCRQAP
jgi:hypothetical protein